MVKCAPMTQRLLASSIVVVLAACGSPLTQVPDAGAAPTYYKDVLPITQVSCNGCHVTGGIAPFALDTYDAAKLKAPLMADAVSNKRMPPWLASKDCGGPFVGDRSLSDAQIATINDWFKAGAPEGNAADAPAPVGAAEQLPKVDLTLQMPQPYTPTLKDDYRCFTIDPALTQEQVVTGYDITPGSKRVVHHVILYIVPRTAAVAKDAQDPTSGWQCFGGANVNTNGTLGAWAPGGAAVRFPAGTGIRVKPNEVVAMQVHYNTENTVEADQTSVKLMYGTGSERSAVLLPIVADGFSIPGNAKDYAHTESFPNSLGFNLRLYGFLPHMHTKGKKISLTGGANNECLVDIQRWDFHWQSQYFRRTPYDLPANSALKINCTWDNPTAGTVTWGEGTSDEMCFAFVYATL
jgi:Copper type II ascorbate-dependent monooxygenase, N-terminal domain/Copper type II ascorbate-dependent monooxygenase, C-terminal domain